MEVGDRAGAVMAHVLYANDGGAAKLAAQTTNNLNHNQVTLQKQLEQWRNAFTIQLAKQNSIITAENSRDVYSVAILSCGGCLDTIAAMRAGFTPKWATEIDPDQSLMFEDLTSAKCLGSNFNADQSIALPVLNAVRVAYMKSGQPCIAYSLSGAKNGINGQDGWHFVKQVDIILHHQPWAICLKIRR